ncbi:hypothetical protein G6F37_010867 [Rhizopus arrhizus]|nr:hypothetical protein G6F38_011405 [Rhizopus arrhizus]KAG1152061.1 hypothetical protein G6F37_010867 [Rhizopus arrhizus]
MQLFKAQTFTQVCLGQLLSLCITGTSSASSALWQHYGISIPFTQNLVNYLILFIVYYGSSILIFKHKSFSKSSWQFLGFSFADVGGNVLAVLAFKRTSVLSALILSSWSIPCIMLLSTYFLHAKYTATHIKSAALCLLGLAILIWCDTVESDDASANHSWIGDVICLMSASLYAISNVTEEHLVRSHTSFEFLGKAGLWGSVLCGIQALYFEYDTWITTQWSIHSVLLVTVYVLCLFCMYSLVPIVYRMAGAAFLSMSLITSNFYSLLVGICFLDAKMPQFYPISYTLVIVGVVFYSLAPSPTSEDDEQRQINKSSFNIPSYT